MTWNYRLVKVDRDGEPEIGLYEVYYDENGTPVSRTQDLATFAGDTRGQLLDALDFAVKTAATTDALDDSLFTIENGADDE